MSEVASAMQDSKDRADALRSHHYFELPASRRTHTQVDGEPRLADAPVQGSIYFSGERGDDAAWSLTLDTGGVVVAVWLTREGVETLMHALRTQLVSREIAAEKFDAAVDGALEAARA
jgi:hypothetical protein